MKLYTPIFASLLIAASVSSAWATNLPPSTSQVPATVPGFFGGTLINQATTHVFTPTFSGWASTAVYENSSGFYDFYYQFSNDAGSTNGIDRLTGFDYTGFNVDAFQTSAAFGIFQAGTNDVDTVDRDSSGVIGLNFSPATGGKILPGTSSYTSILRTDATHYKLGAFGVIDGFTANAPGFAPAVPEPETYAMMLLGVGLLALVRRNKAKKTEARLWNDAPGESRLAN